MACRGIAFTFFFTHYVIFFSPLLLHLPYVQISSPVLHSLSYVSQVEILSSEHSLKRGKQIYDISVMKHCCCGCLVHRGRHTRHV
jgi:hypothetical protein